jgi:hypothetical protein
MEEILIEQKTNSYIPCGSLASSNSTIKKMWESLEAIYPGNWDMQNELDDELLNHYIVYIKFPEIEISNKKDNKHIIKDLYVRIKYIIVDSHVKLLGLDGYRGKMTFEEHSSGYSHSHLPSSSTDNFQPFCLGTSEMADLKADWATREDNFDQILFELFLYQLDAYVRWESLDGGPYKRMAEIRVSNSSHISRSEMQLAFRKVIVDKIEIPCKWDNNSLRFIFENNTVIDILTANEIGPMTYTTPSGIEVPPNSSAKVMLGLIKTLNDNYQNIFKLKFRGKNIIKIINNDGLKAEDDNNLIMRTKSRVAEYVTRVLTNRINLYFIKNYGK